MRKQLVIVVALIALIFLSGCIDLGGLNNSIGDFFSNHRDTNNFLAPNTYIKEVPLHQYTAEKIIYYDCLDSNYAFCATGLEKFFAYSTKYLRCSFEAFEDQQTAEKLIKLLNVGIKIDLLLGHDKTLIDGLPSKDTQYNYFLRNLLNVQIAPIYENFCVNDRGVMVGTFYPAKNNLPMETNFLVIYNTDLAKFYNTKFFEKYSNE